MLSARTQPVTLWGLPMAMEIHNQQVLVIANEVLVYTRAPPQQVVAATQINETGGVGDQPSQAERG